jgi:DNA-binding transcriptional LysR family regulator
MKSARRLWLAPNHPFLKRSAITLEDVANEPYIQLTIDGTEGSTARYWTARKLEPNIVFRSESVEAVRGLIAFGHGVTILSDMMYRRWSLEGDKIEVCDVADDIPTLDVGLMWKGDRISNAAAATFQNFCRIEGVKAT